MSLEGEASSANQKELDAKLAEVRTTLQDLKKGTRTSANARFIAEQEQLRDELLLKRRPRAQ